ncbi:putative gpi-anchor biosynthetic protein [Phaeomoniella chlamydospora]|uniref:GPI ethanolamine phosphate transferase 1 n=1 Tax=Phaeomoniella chlamydospora TaxID=158046 RepID=A0A0G2EF74_PHACM|nr:putative gpi-anchor biosynthetic protein [Phaeomoniella chlamydospora]
MARIGRVGFLATAVIFHLIYIYSIFDIYFVSPVVSGMQEHHVERRAEIPPPAKRLVLFVGDGLRADKAFQSFPDPSPANNETDLTPRPLAPFLRSKVLSHGTFGVSHTRVPTESRPGHVALIAGLYEDVSAVMTGWKHNPVHFDSVFNRSRHTWSWGSPDILPMFVDGAVPGRVEGDTYGAEFEDFTQDATNLDYWVFEKVKELFKSAKRNATLDAALREEKNVFFLHLLGLDTTGHSYRPYSKEYLHNIKVVDQGVKEITELIEKFYDDDKTAFVFTADHGMSDWGSHGDGHPDNTRTPLIAWGSGVAKPKKFDTQIAPGHEDGFSHDWNLNSIQRHDVAQADIAALMSYLVGLAFPVNSVGELPLSYIEADSEEKALAAFANAREVLEMYKVKENQKRATVLRFTPYAQLSKGDESIDSRIHTIENLITSKQYEESIQYSLDLLRHGITGLRYLQTYDWLFLRALVTAGYLGWIAYATTTIIDLHVLHGATDARRTTTTTILFSSILVILYSTLWIQKSSLTYYAYAIFPVVFWEEVFAHRSTLKSGQRILLGQIASTKDYLVLGVSSISFIALLEALVQSYFRREIYTICFILATTWPAMYGIKFLRDNISLVVCWTLGCLAMSTFTLLPAIKVESSSTITFGGLLMFATGILYMVFEKQILARSKASRADISSISSSSQTIIGIQVGLILLAILVTRSSVASLQAKQGLPLGNQVVGWFVLVASLAMPFIPHQQPNHHYLHRLMSVFLTFSPIFIILAISYEGLFYFSFCMTLITWVRLEHRIYTLHKDRTPSQSSIDSLKISTSFHNGHATFAETATNGLSEAVSPLKSALAASHNRVTAIPTTKSKYRSLTLADIRISLFFFFLLQSAFFSTGNIASISSFSLDSVYRLIPIFDPFSQGALLVLKLLIPFALISANLGILNRRIGVAPSALFMVVMAISDVMTLNFFYMVKDEGSWLDIGTTISHFCIASLLSVFVAGLEFLSGVLIGGVEVDYEGSPDLNIHEPEGSGKTNGKIDVEDAAPAKENAGIGDPAEKDTE